jgi:hypothetical protein
MLGKNSRIGDGRRFELLKQNGSRRYSNKRAFYGIHPAVGGLPKDQLRFDDGLPPLSAARNRSVFGSKAIVLAVLLRNAPG